ncbi:hypothetical protein ACSQ67_021560 [Phaseolus vulgaris]
MALRPSRRRQPPRHVFFQCNSDYSDSVSSNESFVEDTVFSENNSVKENIEQGAKEVQKGEYDRNNLLSDATLYGESSKNVKSVEVPSTASQRSRASHTVQVVLANLIEAVEAVQSVNLNPSLGSAQLVILEVEGVSSWATQGEDSKTKDTIIGASAIKWLGANPFHFFGFPYSSLGKSTLLTMLTGTHSEAASYEFTTLTCIPGIIHYNDTKIQLLDLPGIIEGASEGKGRGRQLNLDRLLARMWDEMSLDRGGCTVEDFCNHIHRSLVMDVKYVLVWCTSARHYPPFILFSAV